MTEPRMTDQVARAFSGRRVLVTGGAGFVGGSLTRRLADAGARVTVLDDLFTGRPEVVPTTVQLVRAPSSTRRSSASSSPTRRSSSTWPPGTSSPRRRPARGLRHEHRRDAERPPRGPRLQGRPGRLHGLHVDLRQPPLDPDQRGRPGVTLSPYAVSKLGGEHYCLAFYESYGLPISVVRYSNVFGLGQRPDNPYCGVIASSSPPRSRAAAPGPRRRRADPRLHLHRRRRRRDDAGRDPAARRGRGLQRRDRHRDIGQRARPGDRPRRSASRSTSPHRPPRHRQHPPPRREYREGPPDAPLGAAGHAGVGPRTDGGLDVRSSSFDETHLPVLTPR